MTSVPPTAEVAPVVEPPAVWPIATFNVVPLHLWSATNQVVHYVSTNFFPHYYVWCSPVFEGRAVGRYDRGFGQPPSSDPARIYRSLFEAVRDRDEHNADVGRQRDKLQQVALDLSVDGKISDDAAQEVVAYLQAAHISEWKPMIYAIPYGGVKDRVLAVPRALRASGKPEYVIPDLTAEEFTAIEPMSCD